MQAHRAPATRPSNWLIAPVGRSLLPVVAMLGLAAATAFAAWLLLYGANLLWVTVTSA